MKKTLWYGRAALFAALLSLTLAACGGGDDGGVTPAASDGTVPLADKSIESKDTKKGLHCAP